MPGEHLDLTSSADDGREDRLRAANSAGAGEARPFLGVQFRCCDVYARIYVNREGTAYQGHCPRCSRPVHIRIGPGGSDSRFFEAC
ncbi:MAG: hypothetical protein JNK76_04950 [Planctomycetales bacterium]|nr:hypothetical protein [Planctomycetales bacterium]